MSSMRLLIDNIVTNTDFFFFRIPHKSPLMQLVKFLFPENNGMSVFSDESNV